MQGREILKSQLFQKIRSDALDIGPHRLGFRLDSLLPGLGDGARLVSLVTCGAACYAALLFLFARPVIDEMLALVRPRAVTT